jgi:hypothetical protein
VGNSSARHALRRFVDVSHPNGELPSSPHIYQSVGISNIQEKYASTPHSPPRGPPLPRGGYSVRVPPHASEAENPTRIVPGWVGGKEKEETGQAPPILKTSKERLEPKWPSGHDYERPSLSRSKSLSDPPGCLETTRALLSLSPSLSIMHSHSLP